jgi:hypothetical protein
MLLSIIHRFAVMVPEMVTAVLSGSDIQIRVPVRMPAVGPVAVFVVTLVSAVPLVVDSPMGTVPTGSAADGMLAVERR